MITNYKIFKENILKPTTSIEDKILKTIASNKELLMSNEVLDIEDLEIDETWDFYLDANLIKTKKIIGDVKLHLNNIPSWIKDIEIDGYFGCSHCNLTSLKNCPKIIHKSFGCSNNKLTSLEDGPTFVGGEYYCHNNPVEFTKEYISTICEVNQFVKLKNNYCIKI